MHLVSSSTELYRYLTLSFAISRLVWHLPVLLVGLIYELKFKAPSTNCYDSCGVNWLINTIAMAFVVNDIIGLPFDVFNIYAVTSD